MLIAVLIALAALWIIACEVLHEFITPWSFVFGLGVFVLVVVLCAVMPFWHMLYPPEFWVHSTQV